MLEGSQHHIHDILNTGRANFKNIDTKNFPKSQKSRSELS